MKKTIYCCFLLALALILSIPSIAQEENGKKKKKKKREKTEVEEQITSSTEKAKEDITAFINEPQQEEKDVPPTPPKIKRKRIIVRADNAFENYKYNVALESYLKGGKKINYRKMPEERNRVNFQIAECYRLMNNTRASANAYRQFTRKKQLENRTDTLAFFYCADALLQEGQTEKALNLFVIYDSLCPNDDRGKKGILACDLIEEWTINPGQYEVLHEKKLSTWEDEYSVCYANKALNEIIFTASYDKTSTGKKKDEWTGKKFTDLYTTKKEADGKWILPPVLLDETEILNTTDNEGTSIMNSRFTTLYFTRCERIDAGAAGCGIYSIKRAGSNWGEPKRLDLGGDSLSIVGHPTLSPDERIIVFAADFPGSRGGKDLYLATRGSSTGSFEKPYNIGDSINTTEDELFPHLRGDSLLYFSSAGHQGIGGLDIFRSTITWEKGVPHFSTPENLRTPVNSVKDDFSIIFHPEGEDNGYFSSSRKGGRGGDDIYTFNKEPVVFTISGVITDDRTLQAVEGVHIQLIGSDSSFYKLNSTVEGKFEFNKKQVKRNLNYEVVLEKEGYFRQILTDSTIGFENSKNIIKKINFLPIPKEPIVLPDILYDLAKWDLKPQYEDSLQGLIKIMEANPTIVIELAAHTDSRGTAENNDILSQKRAESVVNYLIDRGIEPGRLQAKGYGERAPRKISDTIIRDGFIFPGGVRLTEEYINSLPSLVQREAAYQLNRRSEFSIINTNFVAGKSSLVVNKVKVEEQVSNSIPLVKIQDGAFRGDCLINGESSEFIYSENEYEAVISEEGALKLLKAGIIGKENFEGDVSRILSDGKVEINAVFTINEIQLGKKYGSNFKVTVSYRGKEALILTKSDMDKFGPFELDREKQQIIFED